MKEIRVQIPEEEHSILEFNREELPGIAVVNTALRDFVGKEAFSWHLSIIMDLEELIDNGMPSRKERAIVDPYGDYLNELVKGVNPEKPNALFLGRVTWNATRQFLWRVYDPEIADRALKEIINSNSSPREFEYQMEHDTDWKLAEWYLAHHKKKK